MGKYTHLDCPECKTRDAEMIQIPGSIVKLICQECGKTWRAPQREAALSQVSDEEFE